MIHSTRTDPSTRRSRSRRDNDILDSQDKLTGAQKDSTRAILTALDKISESVVHLHAGKSKDQDSSNKAVENLSTMISNGRSETEDHFTDMNSMLSNIQQLLQERTRAETSFRASSNTAVPQFFRAELRRILLPMMEQHFMTLKSSCDMHHAKILEAINSMAQDQGHSLHEELMQDKGSSAPGATKRSLQSGSRDTAYAPLGHWVDDEEARLNTTMRHVSSSVDLLSSFRCQTWIVRWGIGVLYVKMSTTRTRREMGAESWAFGDSTSAWADYIYHISVTFQPTRTCISSKGMTLLTGSRSDQSYHSIISPQISTFAVVPDDSDAIKLVRENDIEGLQRLFRNGLTSPSDRRIDGTTLLHVSRHICVLSRVFD